MRLSVQLVALWLILFSVLPSLGVAAPYQLKFRSSYTLPQAIINDIKIMELSGLAWDEDEQILYAISDRGGRLFHLKLQLAGNEIQDIQPLYATLLKKTNGKRLKHIDAEGLTVLNANNGKHGDTELVIATEGEVQLLRFTPDGILKSKLPLPKDLRDLAAYHGYNQALESVDYHPRFGFITAPEFPLKTQIEPASFHTLYSQKRNWVFPSHPVNNSGISALEVLPDGNILVLERAWSGVFNPLTISLRYVDIMGCVPQRICTVDDLKVTSNYLVVDNFEGLTHIQGKQYLMVSDDGDNSFQRTQFILFTLE